MMMTSPKSEDLLQVSFWWAMGPSVPTGEMYYTSALHSTASL